MRILLMFAIGALYATGAGRLPVLAQVRLGSADSLVPVEVSCDRPGVVASDDSQAVPAGPGLPVVLRLSEGDHILRAATPDGRGYWESRIAVTKPGPVTVQVSLASSLKAELDDERNLQVLDAQRHEAIREALEVRSRADEARREVIELRASARERREVALARLHATIEAVRDLERRLEFYTADVSRVTAQVEGLKSQAASQRSTGGTLGMLSGLVGELAAKRTGADVKRNELRARGAMNRMNRLTANLADASDHGFDRLPDPNAPAVFATSLDGMAGELGVSDNRIEFVASGNDLQEPVRSLRVGLEATCSSIDQVRRKGSSLRIRIAKRELTVSPGPAGLDDVMAEIFLACPHRQF